MAKLEIMNSATRALNKVGFKLKKHSPEILIATGIAGTVASTVMACKATTKMETILEQHKEKTNAINGMMDQDFINVESEDGTIINEYTVEDQKKDLTIVYAQTGVEIVKLYAPSVILGGLSIAAILTGHNILRKRYVATAAAYTALDKGFKEYRGRVIERFGKEIDRELKYNIKAKQVEEKVQNEDGTESTVKKTIHYIDPTHYSEYARFFDDGCTGWTKDPEYNLTFLLQQQQYANELLKRRGWLTLNEVYDMLGIPRSKAGMVVGWYYDEKNPVGDNVVDFGIFDTHKSVNRDFVNGYERTILLDFNVDGNIYHLMN